MAQQPLGLSRRQELAVESIASHLLTLALPENTKLGESLTAIYTRLGRGFGDSLVSAVHRQGVPEPEAAALTAQALDAFVIAFQAKTTQRLRYYSPIETEAVEEEDETEDDC